MDIFVHLVQLRASPLPTLEARRGVSRVRHGPCGGGMLILLKGSLELVGYGFSNNCEGFLRVIPKLNVKP